MSCLIRSQGEAMARSVDCLKPFGRFLELGKRDYYTKPSFGPAPIPQNFPISASNADQLLNFHRLSSTNYSPS